MPPPLRAPFIALSSLILVAGLLAAPAVAQDAEAYVSERIDEILGREYETKMISSGRNRPPFSLRRAHRAELILLLREGVPTASIAEQFAWSDAEMERRVGELVSSGLVRRNADGTFLPTVMVMPLGDVARYLPVPASLVEETGRLLVRHLPEVRRRYAAIRGFGEAPFESVSLLVLSNVLLDNWQINTVEARFLGAERPARGESRYYLSIQEKAPFDSTEAFGIYGNQIREYGPATVGIYGNRRTGNPFAFGDLDADRIEALFGTRPDSVRAFQEEILTRVMNAGPNASMPPRIAAGLDSLGWMEDGRVIVPRFDATDREALSEMADLVADELIALLEGNRAAITRVYEASPYAREVTFEEYFMWWYHLFYSEVTDHLIAEGHVNRPDIGITTYLLVGQE